MSEFITLTAPTQAIIREKMSKFIAFASPVQSVEQAKEFIADVANKYHDARHVCWAYMIGAECNEFQSNDNGEPSGTAGKPILGQIRSAGITNVAIAVVRYFGGIKLGTSGLIVAYREAARSAIEAGEKVTCYEMASLTFTFPYMAMNDVMRVVKEMGVKVEDQQCDNSCRMTLSIRRDYLEKLSQRIADISGTSIIV